MSPTRRKGEGLSHNNFLFARKNVDGIVYDRSTNDLLSKASSCHSSSAALSRDQIEHDQWDRNKVMGLQSKHFPNESDGDENKSKKKEDHPMVKYIKFQV